MHKQGDLFAAAGLFPVRRAASDGRENDLSLRSLRIRIAMSQAIKECGQSREIVAGRIAEQTGRSLTKEALDTYTAGSKPEHDISLMRFVALVRSTGAYWLWDELLADDGLVVLQGEEAKLAELGHLEQEEQRIAALKKTLKRELKAAPVHVKRRGQ